MNTFKEIDIAEPIWSKKAVGLAVDDVPMGQNVKVTISYVKKGTGGLLYPGEYIVEVDKIRQYPVETVRGSIRVHIVPIIDLKKLTIFNTNQKQVSMLFSSNELGKIIKDSEEAKANAGNFENKKWIEPGKHIMILESIKLEHAKSDNNPMVVAEFKLSDEHRGIKEFMKIAGPNTDIPREKLVKLFHRGFGYEIQPCQNEADLLNQLVKFQGKQLSIAVKGVKKAYCFTDKEGKDVVMEQTYPEFWYCGHLDEFNEFHIDMSKAVIGLNDEDKEKLIRFAEINGGPFVPQAKEAATTPAPAPASAPVEEPVPTPIPNPIPAPEPVQELKPQPIESVPAATEQPKEAPKTDDDNFPF